MHQNIPIYLVVYKHLSYCFETKFLFVSFKLSSEFRMRFDLIQMTLYTRLIQSVPMCLFATCPQHVATALSTMETAMASYDVATP